MPQRYGDRRGDVRAGQASRPSHLSQRNHRHTGHVSLTREDEEAMRRLITAGFAMLLMATTVDADCSSELTNLEGYTIIAATQVEGDFEGCDFDKVIRFTDGKRLRCSSYSY